MSAVSLKIDHQKCINCSHCVRVCPSNIFFQLKADSPIEIQNLQACIVCGHCVAVCPKSAVLHSDFPFENVHKIDKDLLPSPEQLLLLIRSRRSNRAFGPDPVAEKDLIQIIEAGHRAPTASNNQKVEFSLVRSPEKILEISLFAIESYREILKKLENPIIKNILKLINSPLLKNTAVLKRIIENFDQGNDIILRRAKALIFIHAPKDSLFGREDCQLAYQNASLMGESLGICQFYGGFLQMVIKRKPGKLEKILGIQGQINANMVLGLPLFGYPNYIDKKDVIIHSL